VGQDNLHSQGTYIDEIDLGALLALWVRGKKTIAGITGIFLAVALIIDLLMPKVYEASAVIRIGNISGLYISKAQSLQELQNLWALITAMKKLNLDSGLKKNRSYLYDLGKILNADDLPDTNLVRLRVRLNDPRLAKEICSLVAEYFVLSNRHTYNKEIALIDQRLKALEKDIRKMTSAAEIEARQSEIYSLKHKLAAAKEFAVVDPAITPRRPLDANKKQNIALALVSGLMAGVSWVSFGEFWNRRKASSG